MENIIDSDAVINGCIKALNRKHQDFMSGNRNNFVFHLACMCNRYGVPKDDFLREATIKFQETSYTIAEIRASTKSAYKNLHEHSKYIWKQNGY
jgi:hypothetical protein